MRLEVLTPTKVAVPQIAASASGYQAFLVKDVDYAPGLLAESKLTSGVPHAHEAILSRALSINYLA